MALLDGGIAQLGEHLLCKQGVNGSIPFTSTTRYTGKSKRTLLVAMRLGDTPVLIPNTMVKT